MWGVLMEAECKDLEPSKNSKDQASNVLANVFKFPDLAKKLPQVRPVNLTPCISKDRILFDIYSNSSTALSMQLTHFNALVSMAKLGWCLAMADPEYDDLRHKGFQRQFLINSIYIYDRTLLEEKNGSWGIEWEYKGDAECPYLSQVTVAT